MERWQARIVGRIVDQIDDYLAGRLTLKRMLINVQGLIQAAELHDRQLLEPYDDAWDVLVAEDELRSEPLAQRGLASDEMLASALNQMRDWAKAAGGR